MQRSGAGTGADRKTAGRYELLLKAWDGDPGTFWGGRATDEDPAGTLALIHDLPFSAGLTEETADAIVEAWEWTADARDERIVNAEEPILDDTGLAVASPYTEGEPLGSLLRLASVRRLVFPAPAALRVALDLLEGLSYLHGRAAEMSVGPQSVYGGVHPNQVLIGIDGRTRILEPGIGAVIAHQKVFADDPKRSAYSAPERFEEGEESDATTDLFCVGILMWEQMLAKRLFGALSQAAVAKKVTSQPIERLDAAKPASGAPIDKAVADIVARALERNRADRFQSAGEMTEAILGSGQPVGSHEDVAKVLEQLAGKAIAARKASFEKALAGGASPRATSSSEGRRAASASVGHPSSPRAGKLGERASTESDPESAPKKAPPPPRVGATPAPPRAKPAGPKPGLPPRRAGEGTGPVTDPTTLEGEFVDEQPVSARTGAPRPAKAPAERGPEDGEEPVGTEWEGPISERADEPDGGGDEDLPTSVMSPEDAKALAAVVRGSSAAAPRPAAPKDETGATATPSGPASGASTDARFDDSVHRPEDDGPDGEDDPDAPSAEGEGADAEDAPPPPDGLRADAAPSDEAASSTEDDVDLDGASPAPDGTEESEATAQEAAPTDASPEPADPEGPGIDEDKPADHKKAIVIGAIVGIVVLVVLAVWATGKSEPSEPSSPTSALPTTEATTAAPTTEPETTATPPVETETDTQTEEPDAGEAPETTEAPATTAPAGTAPAVKTRPPSTKPKDKPPTRYVPDDL